MKHEKPLTEVELELMSLLWKMGEGSVNDVLAELPKERKLAYTSVSTMLRILEQKGIVTSRKEGRGHVYVPRLSKSDYESSTIKRVVNQVFDGAPVALVRQLLDQETLTAAELKEIRKLLDERLK
jgi:predicted transcriptional regulator